MGGKPYKCLEDGVGPLTVGCARLRVRHAREMRMRRDLQRALAVLAAVVSSLGRRSFKASEGGGPAEDSAVVDHVPDVHGEPG